MPQTTLERKLSPARLHLSPKLGAMVEAIIQPERRTISPALAGLAITSDGFVIAFAGPPLSHDVFLGAASNWETNWASLLDSAGLTAEEREEAERRYRQVVKDWRVRAQEAA